METQLRESHASSSVVSQQQLTLTQLILWLMATCVVLAYEQWRLKVADAPSETLRWYFNLRLIFYAPLDGACLAALFLCFCRKALGSSRFPCEPGHWLLVVTGVLNVCAAAQTFANHFIGEEQLNAFPDWVSATYGAVAWVISAAVALFAAWDFRKELLWSLTFVAVTLSTLDPVLHVALLVNFKGKHWFLEEFAWGFGSRVVYSMPAVFAILAIITERSSHRDLLHWVGVVVLILRVVAEWPSWLVWVQLFR